MEQKDYKLEIVLELLREPCHIRKLAKKLNINHMTILRNINNLLRENVVDFREEGRNKVYFLKKTFEAKKYVFMAENYKSIKILEKYPRLRTIFEKIRNHKSVKLAMLFGSYANQTSTDRSDIDIYIKTENKKLKNEFELIDSRVSIKIGKYQKSNNLIKEIEKNHVIIKGVEEFYDANKFFE